MQRTFQPLTPDEAARLAEFLDACRRADDEAAAAADEDEPVDGAIARERPKTQAESDQ